MSQENRLLFRARVRVLNNCFLFFLGQCKKQRNARERTPKSAIVPSNAEERSKRPPLESKRARR